MCTLDTHVQSRFISTGSSVIWHSLHENNGKRFNYAIHICPVLCMPRGQGPCLKANTRYTVQVSHELVGRDTAPLVV
jgi:hypothetical protein